MVNQISFAEALERSAFRRRHLLLGNGFSVAARSKFSYWNLTETAKARARAVAQILASFGTENFEVAIEKCLAGIANAISVGDAAERARFENAVCLLRNGLLETIAFVHPGGGFELSPDEYQSCCDFLSPFVGRKLKSPGIVFTTNYDLLLYWVLVRHHKWHSQGELQFQDAFEYDKWLPERMRDTKLSAVYLHGSLHIFERDHQVERVVYSHGSDPKNIVTQIRARLEKGEFPLFISEGNGKQKALRMRESVYLNAALQKFRFACAHSGEVLFTVGHSLSEQDAHLTDFIGKGRTPAVYVGAFGGLHSNDGRRAVELAEQWAAMRKAGKGMPLTVSVFDSRECQIWTRKSAFAA